MINIVIITALHCEIPQHQLLVRRPSLTRYYYDINGNISEMSKPVDWPHAVRRGLKYFSTLPSLPGKTSRSEMLKLNKDKPVQWLCYISNLIQMMYYPHLISIDHQRLFILYSYLLTRLIFSSCIWWFNMTIFVNNFYFIYIIYNIAENWKSFWSDWINPFGKVGDQFAFVKKNIFLVRPVTIPLPYCYHQQFLLP